MPCLTHCGATSIDHAPSAALPFDAMARRRYQRGSLGFANGEWYGRWREDVRLADGTVRRRHRQQRLGTRAELPTKRLARRAFDALLAEVNAPGYRPRAALPFSAAIVEWHRLAATLYRPSTLHTALIQMRKYVAARWGAVPICAIVGPDVETWAHALPVGVKTRYNVLALMRKAWELAVERGWTTAPFPRVRLPRLAAQRGRAFSAEEVRAIITAADEPWATLYALLAETGLRIGEAAALRWSDVRDDLALDVRRSAWEGRLGSPKTVAGCRVVAITDDLLGRLAEHRHRSERASAEELIFATRRGTPIRGRKVVEDHLAPLLARLGIPRAGLHAFRHANATELLRAGVPLRTVSARLGHADVTTTLRVYAHAVSADDARAASSAAAIFAPSCTGAEYQTSETADSTSDNWWRRRELNTDHRS